MRTALAILLFGLLILPDSGLAVDLSAANTVEAQEIELLINQLAATAAEPAKGSNDLGQHEPKIWEAVDKLHALGVKAFPDLIAHYDDERYSCCEDSPAASVVYHQSVGYVCRKILRQQVGVYVPWDVGDTRGKPGHGSSPVPYKQSDAEIWCSSNKGKALWEIQAQNVEQVLMENRQRLGQEKNAEYRTACEKAIRENEKLLSDLTAKKSPLSKEPWRPYIGR